MVATAGDVDVIRFTLDIDPDSATFQDTTMKTAVAGVTTNFILTKYAHPIKFNVVDVASGSGTKRKIQVIALGVRTAG